MTTGDEHTCICAEMGAAPGQRHTLCPAHTPARTNEQVEADREAAKRDRVRCLEEDGSCAGVVEYRTPLSGSGVSYPRCDTHWARRLATQDEINRKYPTHAPSDFDPTYAGERWDED